MKTLLEMLKKIWLSNYEVKRSLPLGKAEKNIRLMKDKLGGKYWKNLYPWDLRCASITQTMDVLTRKQRMQRKQRPQRNVLSKDKSNARTTKGVWKIIIQN